MSNFPRSIVSHLLKAKLSGLFKQMLFLYMDSPSPLYSQQALFRPSQGSHLSEDQLSLPHPSQALLVSPVAFVKHIRYKESAHVPGLPTWHLSTKLRK